MVRKAWFLFCPSHGYNVHCQVGNQIDLYLEASEGLALNAFKINLWQVELWIESTLLSYCDESASFMEILTL